jgi:hypothetical protein
MLDPATFLSEAQALPLGGRRRVDHICGGGRTMIINHKPDGWSAYCWRCSDKGWVPAPTPSLEERIARLKAKETIDAAAEADPRPPLPANFDPSTWPLYARVWLYKAGLTNDRIRDVGAYYHERLDRVVLPVVEAGRLAYWQARGFDKDRPKYINPPIDKTGLFARYGSSGPIVLTEDILSAYRVGAVARGYAIMGTALSDRQVSQLLTANSSIAAWFDPDGPGRRASAKVRKALALAGVACRDVRGDRDPKLYSEEEIRTHIYGS